jgi:hypothetical protein
MTIALAIIGGTAVILGAAAKIPPALSALMRACIPVIAAARELRSAIDQGRVKNAGADDGTLK